MPFELVVNHLSDNSAMIKANSLAILRFIVAENDREWVLSLRKAEV